eukprot:CAMPEP_0197020108 /NCGR_PEP_ID=MMETSP1384-20130603/822_1 /TAXON_ID=29189 /ORGANISM="Ammonia sp." /LENGTH=86 /DNA_ID=CAMNT_0042447669 /DNA_START=25 /DNA_END=282 /DNA_ORIENTATION=+
MAVYNEECSIIVPLLPDPWLTTTEMATTDAYDELVGDTTQEIVEETTNGTAAPDDEDEDQDVDEAIGGGEEADNMTLIIAVSVSAA